MADTPHIITNFRGYVRFELRCKGIDGAGKHKILPHDQSQLITEIVEEIIGIIPASPDPDYIKIAVPAVLQKRSCPLPVHTAPDAVLRNIIRSHRKNLYAVYLMGKPASILICSGIYFHRS